MKPALRKALEVRWKPGWRNGAICLICSQKRAKAIGKDLIDFLKESKKGHPMPWAAFSREYLKAEYGFEPRVDSMRRHLKKCMGQSEA